MSFVSFVYLGIVTSISLPHLLRWASMNNPYVEPYSQPDADVVVISTDDKKFRAHSFRLRANR
jgi:hypothetical protein